MIRRWGWGLFAVALAPGSAAGQWLDLSVPARPASTAEEVEAGRELYDTHCWYCHGEEGDGGGPIAPYLWPRPRDFTLGSYKLRTTTSGELPTDEDLFRTISRGVPGTAMPAWQSALSPRERWQVIDYLKTFADGMFEDEEFDPYRALIDIGRPPRGDLVTAGRAVFEQSDCWECHGAAGRGDGAKAPELTDDWGYPIPATDLEMGWKYKGGSAPRDVYARLSTGLDGSPMPSYAQTLTAEERWQVAHYTASLVRVVEKEDPGTVVIAAARVRGELPADPDAPAWSDAVATRVPLTGQATFTPRWQTPAVTDLVVQALHNDREIAFRLQWNDRTRDVVPGDSARAYLEGWTADDTYPVILPDGARVRGVIRDAVEVMFPADPVDGPALPHFVYGDERRPVDVWRWQADAATGAVRAHRARGAGSPPVPNPRPAQAPSGVGRWEDGRWTLIMRRALITPDGEGVQFRGGGVVPVAFHARDGENGETGLRMSLSSWFFLHLEEPVRPGRLLLVFVVVLGVAVAEYGLVRVVRARGARGAVERRGRSR